MNPLPGKCPVCANALTVTRLHCGQCGTGIDGAFGLGRLQALTPEQVSFVETFVKCRGKIKDVEAELDISYPTVVGKLNDVVRAMGYEVKEGEMSEVDQFEFYQARVLNPQTGGGRGPTPPNPALPPMVPMPPIGPQPPPSPQPGGPKLSAEKRQQILDELASGKLSTAEALKKLHGA